MKNIPGNNGFGRAWRLPCLFYWQNRVQSDKFYTISSKRKNVRALDFLGINEYQACLSNSMMRRMLSPYEPARHSM